MSYKADLNHETHHFEIYIPPFAKTVIIGTFPTHRRNYNETFAFYYGSKDNNFWNVIEKVYNHKFQYFVGEPAKGERKEFLKEKQIGITDMIYECYRLGKSSSDTSLYPTKLTDVLGLLNQQLCINKIILTSRTGIVSSLGLFKLHLKIKGMSSIKFTKNDNNVLEGTLILNKREIKILVPYSTSPRVVKDKKNNVSQEDIEEMYKWCLLK